MLTLSPTRRAASTSSSIPLALTLTLTRLASTLVFDEEICFFCIENKRGHTGDLTVRRSTVPYLNLHA